MHICIRRESPFWYREKKIDSEFLNHAEKLKQQGLLLQGMKDYSQKFIRVLKKEEKTNG